MGGGGWMGPCIHEFINLIKQAHVPITLQCLTRPDKCILVDKQPDTMLRCELIDNTCNTYTRLRWRKGHESSYAIIICLSTI